MEKCEWCNNGDNCVLVKLEKQEQEVPFCSERLHTALELLRSIIGLTPWVEEEPKADTEIWVLLLLDSVIDLAELAQEDGVDIAVLSIALADALRAEGV